MPRGYPAEPKTLGEHIRRRRLDQGLTQRILAERWCVRSETIAAWELGRTGPGIRQMAKIVRFLGFDPEPSGSSSGERLKAARRRAGLTQVELAGRLGVDEGTVVDLEAGRRRPGRRVREAVADFLVAARCKPANGDPDPT